MCNFLITPLSEQRGARQAVGLNPCTASTRLDFLHPDELDDDLCAVDLDPCTASTRPNLLLPLDELEDGLCAVGFDPVLLLSLRLWIVHYCRTDQFGSVRIF